MGLYQLESIRKVFFHIDFQILNKVFRQKTKTYILYNIQHSIVLVRFSKGISTHGIITIPIICHPRTYDPNNPMTLGYFFSPLKCVFLFTAFQSHTIHVWYIYLHLVDFYGKLVGKYTSHMDPSWESSPENPPVSRFCSPRTWATQIWPNCYWAPQVGIVSKKTRSTKVELVFRYTGWKN